VILTDLWKNTTSEIQVQLSARLFATKTCVKHARATGDRLSEVFLVAVGIHILIAPALILKIKDDTNNVFVNLLDADSEALTKTW